MKNSLIAFIATFLLALNINSYGTESSAVPDLKTSNITKEYFQNALKYDKEGEYLTAEDCLKKAIEKQDSAYDYIQACFMLANYYYESRKGIPQNKKEALELYNQVLNDSLKKAEAGNAEFQYIVAICTKRAKFKSKQALAWLEKSANKGNATAQGKLAFWLMKGFGSKPDFKQAAAWAKKASGQGDMLGRALLGSYYVMVEKDEAKGIPLLEQSAQAGNAGGQYMLYRCLYYGKGIKRDQKRAMELLQKAADQGLDDAVTKLKIMNQNKVN